jgi:hypothetical protein
MKYIEYNNGTSYHAKTAPAVIDAIENARLRGWRIRVHYGDTVTGVDWMDVYDVTGRVSRSMGPVKVPILLANSRSHGGSEMLTHCIVRIRHASKKNGGDIYRHPQYHRPERSRANDLPAETTGATA